MHPKLKISSFLLKRLERIKQQCSGCLFGVLYGDGTLVLLGFNVESTIGQLNYKHIQYKFPAELDLCGLVKFGDCTDAEAHISEILKDVDITDNPILLQMELGTLVGLKASIYMHEKLEQIPYEVMEPEELYRDFCFSRIICNLMLHTETTVDLVKKNMHALRKTVAGGSIAFHVRNTSVYLTGAGNCPAQNITTESSISSIVQLVSQKTNESGGDEKGKKKPAKEVAPTEFGIITIDVLKNKTKERSEKTALPPAAISMYMNRDEKKISIPLNVEAMAILYKKTRLTRFYDILIESICRSLRLFEYAITERLDEGKSPVIPRSYHFFPPEFGHFFTCVYPEGISDDETTMQQKRKKLHYHFGLPASRPYFRRANCYMFRDEMVGSANPLLNTHIGLRPSGVTEGRQYLVQGNYSYYHYLQQGMQDKGWGCAYRSLQTLCSWFRWQGYTERDTPTHLEIQKYLVRIEDKPQSFVGSTQWIGSTEVSMCLQGFLNVDSKIMHCSSGADLGTLGSDLAMHFQSQGTPIMIGGGVLAHTIIGIDYNSQAGKIKFLILDPHYTGTDDLSIIQSKGWCGWKGVEFWDKKSYYNLCMPQRPIMY